MKIRLSREINLNFINRGYWFLGGAFLTIAIAIAALAILRLNLGIDFTSGTSFDVRFENDPGTEIVREALSSAGHDDAIVQKAGGTRYFIRTRDLGAAGLSDIQDAFEKVVRIDFSIPSTTSVGQSVAENTVRNAIIAVLVAAAFVMVYVMYAFRTIPGSPKYAVAAIIALCHDVLVVLGLFAVLGAAINAEVNAIFVVGILTVIGYSVHDTIVIFDRIRENVALVPTRPFANSVNISITESISRSLTTSITTAAVIIAMLLFGGATLRDFLIVLLAGVIVGTYSSLFLAAQLLVIWDAKGFGWLAFWRRGSNRVSERA